MSRTILITGVSGELGSALVRECSKNKDQIFALDKAPPHSEFPAAVEFLQVDICDKESVTQLFLEHNFDVIYHFAALLSSASEKNPFVAHRVNVEGTISLLESACALTKKAQPPCRFIFPSSIAVYGSKQNSDLRKRVSESELLSPRTVYGLHKLYVEKIGEYFSSAEHGELIDFRSIRFPGLISVDSLPSGGTSDYAAEMLHHAARNEEYSCFVGPGSALPFMTMPDAVSALLQLEKADKAALSQRVYNVNGFSATAQQLAEKTQSFFPHARTTFAPVQWRQDVVDSWPDDVDDSLAKRDWGFKAEYDLHSAFVGYLIPGLKKRYSLDTP